MIRKSKIKSANAKACANLFLIKIYFHEMSGFEPGSPNHPTRCSREIQKDVGTALVLQVHYYSRYLEITGVMILEERVLLVRHPSNKLIIQV